MRMILVLVVAPTVALVLGACSTSVHTPTQAIDVAQIDDALSAAPHRPALWKEPQRSAPRIAPADVVSFAPRFADSPTLQRRIGRAAGVSVPGVAHLIGGPTGDTTQPVEYFGRAARGPQTSAPPRRRRIFPLLGRKVQEKGHDLPYPVGAQVGYFFTEREMEITRLQVTRNGNPVDVESVVIEPQSRASAWEARIDLWLFPFLNIYGFTGRLATNTRTRLTVPDPRPGPGRPDLSVELPTKLEGTTRGAGFVLSGGYKRWFAALNMNWSKTELGFEDEIDANVNSIRLGRYRTLGKFDMSAWFGGVLWNMKKQVEGSLDTPGGSIDFAVDYEPVEPFNFMCGAHVTYDKRFEIIAEYGFWDNVTTLLISAGVRI